MTLLQPFDQHRTLVTTTAGVASCIDTGGPGRAAVFLHGLGTSSYLWRHVIAQVQGSGRRSVAVDLPLHGSTPAAQDQDFSLTGPADFVQACCRALELGAVALVANDTGEPSRKSSPPGIPTVFAHSPSPTARYTTTYPREDSCRPCGWHGQDCSRDSRPGSWLTPTVPGAGSTAATTKTSPPCRWRWRGPGSRR